MEIRPCASETTLISHEYNVAVVAAERFQHQQSERNIMVQDEAIGLAIKIGGQIAGSSNTSQDLIGGF